MSIPYSQYLRLKRNCSKNADFEKEAKALHFRLKERGYSNNCLKKTYNRAKNQDRMQLIHGQKVTKPECGVRLTRYSGQQKQVRSMMQKYWYLLFADPTVSKYVKTTRK